MRKIPNKPTPHGSVTGYSNYKCRCTGCKAAMSKYRKENDCRCSKCKAKSVNAQRKYRATESGKATIRERVATDKYKKIQKDYRKSNAGKAMRKKSNKNYNTKNPQKIKAHKAVAYAIKAGKLVRPNVCERCGTHTFTEASHTDYLNLLDVEWLCRPCHMEKDGTAFIESTEDELMEVDGLGEKKAGGMWKALDAVQARKGGG